MDLGSSPGRKEFLKVAAGAAEPKIGTVLELLPSEKCRVELENRQRIIAHLGAATKINFVRLRPGDQVAVVVAERDQTRGRIVKLLDAQATGRARGVL
jgi:translation initiation factor IF-1